MADLVFHYAPLLEPDSHWLKEGVTEAYLYVWDGKPGPASVAKVAALVDGEGVVSIMTTGEFEPCTVVDDS